MRIAALVLGSLFSLGAIGCSSSNKEADALADKLCACKTPECISGVEKELTEWTKNNVKSEGDAKALEKTGKKIAECMTKMIKVEMPGGAKEEEKKPEEKKPE